MFNILMTDVCRASSTCGSTCFPLMFQLRLLSTSSPASLCSTYRLHKFSFILELVPAHTLFFFFLIGLEHFLLFRSALVFQVRAACDHLEHRRCFPRRRQPIHRRTVLWYLRQRVGLWMHLITNRPCLHFGLFTWGGTTKPSLKQIDLEMFDVPVVRHCIILLRLFALNWNI